MPRSRRTLPLAIACTLLAAIPASAQKASVETHVWIDVATHTMAGMPDLGLLGGLAGRMAGAGMAPQGYPESRNIPGAQGKLLDIAMLNTLQPGTRAEQQVPAGLGVGKSLALLPPPPGQDVRQPDEREVGDVEVTIRQYWGCGAGVRPGQPKVMTLRIRDGKAGVDGGLAAGLFVPDRDVDASPQHALWPNIDNRRRVSERSSLVGQHRITGPGVPASLQFELGANADFLPKIALQVQGELAGSVATQWQPVERARAYFLNAIAMQDTRNFVVWSSSEVAGAGHELMNYLTGTQVDRWLGQKVLLAPSTTRCAIPKGIFQSSGRGEHGGMASLNLIAYGPETNIVWPPKPADPKQPWDPEWNVRVRTKSTASAMLGLDLSGMSGMDGADDEDSGEEPAQQEEGKGKRLLKGLLRNF